MVTVDSRDQFVSPAYAAERKMSIGQVFSDTFRVVGRAWPYLLVLVLSTLLIGLPLMLSQSAIQAEVMQHPGQPMTPEMLAQYKSAMVYRVPVMLLQTLLSLYIFATVADGAGRVLEGDSFQFGRALKTGLRRFFPVLASAFAFYLMLIVGLVLFVAPGVWIGAVFGLAPSLAVLEKRGPFSSLSRSRALTLGHRWRSIAATFVLFLALLAVYAIEYGILRLVGFSATVWVSSIASFLTLPLLYVFPTVMTVQLKRLELGGGPGSIAEVF